MWFLEGAISMLLLHSNVTKTLNKELVNSKVPVKVYKKEPLILLNKNVFSFLLNALANYPRHTLLH